MAETTSTTSTTDHYHHHRPHRTSSINSGATTFICFTSRLSSSSSMRLSSSNNKASSSTSILSPARAASLSNSLSRRLRTSGSIKGGLSSASPMFRKRGSGGFENSGSGSGNNAAEPSSPKVTCIGQVRVKTRKHVKKTKMRAAAARSRRREASFRRSVEKNDGGSCHFDAGGDNRWVHLPVTICESLRSFGSELNCFFPCRSDDNNDNSNYGRRDGRENGGGCGGGGRSCGAVFTRWFVAVEETGGGGERREIELVVGGGDEDVVDETEEAEEKKRMNCRRRHVFEDIDFASIETKAEEKKEEGGDRVSICPPPKNALLLMRCRSDPVKVAALANRVRKSALSQNDLDIEEEEDKDGRVGDVDEKEEERRRFEMEMEDKKRIQLCEKWISGESLAEIGSLVLQPEEQGGNMGNQDEVVEDEYEEEMEAKFIKTIEDELRNVLEEEDMMVTGDLAEASEEGEKLNQESSIDAPEPDTCPTEKETAVPAYEVLPDCLLLMMCEPKLSMEVSKETWVCKTDFVRWLPERPPPVGKKEGQEAGGDEPKKRLSTDSNSSAKQRSRTTTTTANTNTIAELPRVAKQVALQPGRSSCSYPAAPPLVVAAAANNMTEHKVAGGKAYEPLALKRCKSEPRRSEAKLAPENCFWKNRKLEPHRPTTLGVGAAGVGF